MKTAKIKLESIKASDAWFELIHVLKFEEFQKTQLDLDEDELADKFYSDVVSKKFKYGEFADIELIVDENYNIVGGRIL